MDTVQDLGMDWARDWAKALAQDLEMYCVAGLLRTRSGLGGDSMQNLVIDLVRDWTW